MSDQAKLNDCGCCADDEAKPTLYNRPGLDALDYRVATHPTFFKRMLARLGQESVPDGAFKDERPLGALTTRAADDFTIGLLDSWAVVGDVLTFYQERIANEGFLGTATERRSILELARAIGYELNPGVAAGAYLAFTVDESDTTPDEIEVPVGVQVQSLPQMQDELPQTFETAEAINARPAWNRFVPCQTTQQLLNQSTIEVIFAGVSTNLRVGDRLLFVGEAKEDDHSSNEWDVRRVLAVDSDANNNRTVVSVETGSRTTFPASPKVYAFREQANIFGHNTVDWPSLSVEIMADYLGYEDPADVIEEDKKEWPHFTIFAPGPNLLDQVIVTKEVYPTARMVGDAAIQAADTQAKFLTRSAISSVPTAAFNAISVLETLTREFTDLTVSTGVDGGQSVGELMAADSPVGVIIQSVQNILTMISLAPPATTDVKIDPLSVYTDADDDNDFDLDEFLADVDNLKPDKLIGKINTALTEILKAPFSIQFSDDVTAEMNTIRDALNSLWELNPALRILSAMERMIQITNTELTKALRSAERSVNTAIGAGSSSAISGVLKAVLESALLHDPTPEEMVTLVRFTTKVATYAAAMPTAAMLDANSAVSFVLNPVSIQSDENQTDDVQQDSVGGSYNLTGTVAETVVADLIDSRQSILAEMALPAELQNLSDDENRMAFYAAIGTLGVGAVGAGMAVATMAGAAPARVGLSPALATVMGTSLLPLLGVGIAPLVATAPDFVAGIEDVYQVANTAAIEAAKIVSEPVATLRPFHERTSNQVDLDNRYKSIVPESWVYFSTSGDADLYFAGKAIESSRAEYMITAKITRLQLSGSNLTRFEETVRDLTVYAAPEQLTLADVSKTVTVAGTTIRVDGLLPPFSPGQTLLVAGTPENSGTPTAEAVTVKSFALSGEQSVITLENELTQRYIRNSVNIYGNVTPATHGETVAGEVLGHGSGATPHQTFALKKPPLTYTAADTVTGSESTLSVRVNNVAWSQVPSLYDQEATAKVFAVRLDNEANAFVHFGDGRSGDRLPTGSENVTATYRSGIGLAGEVAAGTLTLLKTKPYGVKSVLNPAAAQGAEDPEAIEDARDNAPVTVRTLDRIVSLRDYEDFAATFAGIGKAQAVPIWDGTRELVHLTVADPTGDEVDADKIALLLSAMEQVRDPLRQVIVESFRRLEFNLSARVLYDGAHQWVDVDDALRAALQAAYAFDQRQFGQAVSAAGLLAVMHEIDAVIAVDLDQLYIINAGDDGALNAVLGAGIATFNKHSTAADIAGSIDPAGILTINSDGIKLKERSA